MNAQQQQPQLPAYPAGRREPENEWPATVVLLLLFFLFWIALEIRVWWDWWRKRPK